MDTAKDEQPISRSSFITVLAWIFIVLSGFSTLIAAVQNIMINTVFPVEQMQATMSSAKEKQTIPFMAGFMIGHVREIFGAVLVLALMTFTSSVALLKRKNWARIITMFILGLGIVWNVGSLALNYDMFSTVLDSLRATSSKSQPELAFIPLIIIVFSVCFTVGLSVLFAWLIKRLASQEIKKEFKVAP